MSGPGAMRQRLAPDQRMQRRRNRFKDHSEGGLLEGAPGGAGSLGCCRFPARWSAADTGLGSPGRRWGGSRWLEGLPRRGTDGDRTVAGPLPVGHPDRGTLLGGLGVLSRLVRAGERWPVAHHAQRQAQDQPSPQVMGHGLRVWRWARPRKPPGSMMELGPPAELGRKPGRRAPGRCWRPGKPQVARKPERLPGRAAVPWKEERVLILRGAWGSVGSPSVERDLRQLLARGWLGAEGRCWSGSAR